MFRKNIALLIIIGLTAILLPGNANAQDKQPSSEQVKEMQNLTAKIAGFQRLSRDLKMANELKITAEQRRKIQIATQKFQDAMMNRRASAKSDGFGMEAYRKLTKELLSSVDGVLSKEQSEKLAQLTEKQIKAQKAFTPQNMQEMQRLTSLMMELQQLSYNAELAEKLELTTEQRVEIREASQKFQLAMQERMKANQGEEFNMERYNEMMGDLLIDAQAILTVEQSEKLARAAKLKRLKRENGDEFGMIKGLAKDFSLKPGDEKALGQKIDDAREKYYADILQLKKETLEKILSEVPREHREEVREAVGEFLEENPMTKQNPFSGAALQIGN